MCFPKLFISSFFAASLFSFELSAQDDKTAVMHAAALFIKDSFPGGPVLLELKGIQRNSTVGDAVARSLNATRGTTKSAIACTAIDTTHKRLPSCSIQGKQVLVEIHLPYVMGNKAETTVKLAHQYAPGKIGSIAWALELLRDTTGAWRVSKILETGRS
jgi:hypothetical protein